MLGKTHATVGSATATAVACLTGGNGKITQFAVAAAIGAIAGLMPDIDSGKSMGAKIARRFVPASLAVMFIGYLTLQYRTSSNVIVEKYFLNIVSLMVFIAMTMIGMRSPHREKTHSFLFCVITTVCVIPFGWGYAIFWFTGYSSHGAIDLLNNKVESLLYPLPSKTCYKICSSNGIVNNALFYLGAIFTVAFIVVGAF